MYTLEAMFVIDRNITMVLFASVPYGIDYISVYYDTICVSLKVICWNCVSVKVDCDENACYICSMTTKSYHFWG